MHRLRVLSAVLLLPPFFLLVQYGPAWLFHVTTTAVILLSAWEFARLCPCGSDAALRLCTAAAATTWQAAVLGALPVAAVLPLAVAAGMACVLFGPGDLPQRTGRAAWLAFGVAYVGALPSSWSLLRVLPDGRELIFFLAFTIWGSDIGAYYVGSRWGRRRLAPRISPKKSVEGLLGGVLAGMAVAAIGANWLWPGIPLGAALWSSPVLVLIGVMGDLSESALKRGAGVKDSGTLIPGHGGVLDRLDSLMFAGPLLYFFARMGWV